jgi:hypothetical protein
MSDEDFERSRFFGIHREETGTNTNARLADGLDRGQEIPRTTCMRDGCTTPRWKHGNGSELVLCREHVSEVIRGERRAPPLRRGIDYSSIGRKHFFIEDLPGDTKK